MIILKIPKRIEDRNLREFILNQVKKFRRNQRHKHIGLEGEIAYSRGHVFFIFPDRALELAFALSLYFKCQQHSIPCGLEVAKPVIVDQLLKEIVEAAKVWSRRKLPRRFYHLRNTWL